jgi:hypothetical protein
MTKSIANSEKKTEIEEKQSDAVDYNALLQRIKDKFNIEHQPAVSQKSVYQLPSTANIEALRGMYYLAVNNQLRNCLTVGQFKELTGIGVEVVRQGAKWAVNYQQNNALRRITSDGTYGMWLKVHRTDRDYIAVRYSKIPESQK